MANTYSNLFYHFVFSTKRRARFTTADIENRVWAYIGGVARKHGMTAVQVGGIENHIHALIMAKPTMEPSRIALFIKGDTSRWIHETFSELADFGWQDGYGIFSVSKTKVAAVVKYIQNQREHHASETFEEEYERIMKIHGVEFDPRYLFD